MGYYTSYSLDIRCEEKDVELVKKFQKELLDVSYDDPDVRVLIEDGGVWAKLYDIEELINELAPKYPELLIILYGDGEDSYDTWERRWKGSESELQQAAIPPFKNPNLRIKEEYI